MAAVDALLDDPQILLDAVDRELAVRSLYEFAKQAWHVIEPDTRFVDGWHLQAICEHLQAVSDGQIRNLAINVPPGTTKSILCAVIWPTWEWVSRPGTRFLGASYNVGLALRDAVRARRLIDSSWYQQRWGRVFRMVGDQNVKGRYENSRTGVRVSGSVDSGTTGEKGDILLLDDPHDVRRVDRSLIREEARRWWSEAFFNRVNDPVTGRRVVIGQRSHEDDLFTHLEKTGGFEWLVIPEEFEGNRRQSGTPTSVRFSDPRTVPGELLRPERFGPEQIHEAKLNLGDRGYAGQHQQRPFAREGNLFKRAGFQTVVRELPAKLKFVRYWDLASTSEAGCYSAGVLIGRTLEKRDRRYYVVNVRRGQWGTDVRNQAMLDTARLDKERYGRVLTVVEQEPGSSGVDRALDFARLLDRFRYEADKVTGSKEVRAEPWASAVNGGIASLYVDDDEPWHRAFIDEHLAFPAGKYVDQVDAAAGAYNKLSQASSSDFREFLNLNHETEYAMP